MNLSTAPPIGERDDTDDGMPRPIDWRTFWEHERHGHEWLVESVLLKERGHAFYAAHGSKKSLLGLAILAQLIASGEKVIVVYIDLEMTEDDVRDRLEDMGFGADSDLSRLRYYLMPDLPPLNTEVGGFALLSIVDEIRAETTDHIIVVIDTTARAVVGEENKADTIHGFYRHTGMPLKQRGITLIRFDHAGKDDGRGQRGSSAKGDDVDIIWRLEALEDGVVLHREKSRVPYVPDKVVLRQLDDPLRFEQIPEAWPPGTEDVAVLLDKFEVPIDAGVRVAKKALQGAGVGRRTDIVSAAQRYRRQGAGAGNASGNASENQAGNTTGNA